MADILTVEGLCLGTTGTRLVEDLSFTIGEGERFGLIGESGSGKSLTALAVNGILPAAIRPEGRITLAGEEVVGAPERRLAGLRGSAVATVFQEPLTALDPLMTLGRQIALPVKRRRQRTGEDTRRAAVNREVLSLVEQVRLPEPERIVHAFPHEVSGGQRQRVAIAMALACRPRLLIADEPTTALDVTTQDEIVKLLLALVEEHGIALLFISHDLAVVGQVAERVLVMRDGRAVETGPARQVLTAPAEAYTRTLVEAARRFDAALEGRP
ncbi:ATP-binding cassette domain-containing protein [Celeribacter indicus]|uniref:ABC transporter n=1 Tax=Celeribacter indicus TaxID=1208324 RepID=A0A0B5E037_9RHOB|nr:ABC transporter ATP-binding protein [Celeribacter indicus]AJE45817.1 ABC transporter [Celeribacter indicus]SDW61381.1 ABC-type dipeptide/oligopeptide/nickel transport system, ATPase component [Celeribacter indicus]